MEDGSPPPPESSGNLPAALNNSVENFPSPFGDAQTVASSTGEYFNKLSAEFRGKPRNRTVTVKNENEEAGNRERLRGGGTKRATRPFILLSVDKRFLFALRQGKLLGSGIDSATFLLFRTRSEIKPFKGEADRGRRGTRPTPCKSARIKRVIRVKGNGRAGAKP